MSDQLGIDKIKAAMKLAADLRNTTADALADGGGAKR